MLEIKFEDPHLHKVELVPEAKVRQLAANTKLLNERPLTDRLSIADPIVVPLTAKQAFKGQDPAIADFLAKHKDKQRYFLVHIACSFAPPDGEPINRAWVIVKLRGADQNDGQSVVISMNPKNLLDVQNVERGFKAGAKIELTGGGSLGFELGPDVKVPEGKLFIVAKDIGKPNVGWEMTQTVATKIGGIYEFNLIVQAPGKQITHGTVDSQVEIQRKFFGLVTYNAMLEEHPFSRFVCSPAD